MSLVIYLVFKSSFIPFGAKGEEKFRFFTGDEPHYCLIAHSLVFDHDFDIKNNVENRDYANFYPQRMTGHVFRSRENRYSSHRLGLPLIISPAYYIGFSSGIGVRLSVVTFMSLLTALLAVNIYSLACEISENRFISILTWICVSFTLPILLYSTQVYPEIPAALLAIYAFRKIRNYKKNNIRDALIIGCCLACFPWLHERFLIFTLSLFIFFLFTVSRSRQCIDGGAKFRKKVLLLFFIPLIISGILQVGYNYLLYGLPIPIQEGWYEGTYDVEFGFFNREGIYVGMLGLLFDRAEGLFVFSPLYIFIFLGMVTLWRDRRVDFWWFILVFFSYYLTVASFGSWWGGGGPPPRFVVAAAPLLTVPLAYSLKKVTLSSFRGAFAFLLILSLFLGFYLMRDPSPLYIFGPGHRHGFAFENVFGLAGLEGYLPSFYENRGAALWLTLFWFSLIMGVSLYCYRKSLKGK